MNYVSAMLPRLLSRTSSPHNPVVQRSEVVLFSSHSCFRVVRPRAVSRRHHRVAVRSVGPDEEQIAEEKSKENQLQELKFQPGPGAQASPGLPPEPRILLRGPDGTILGNGPQVHVQFSVHYLAFNRQLLCLAGNTAPLGWAFNSVSKHPATWDNNVWCVTV